MLVIDASDARKEFSRIVNTASFGDERIIIKKNGKEVVALVSYADLELLDYLESRIDIEEAKQALAELKAEGGTTLDQLKDELGI